MFYCRSWSVPRVCTLVLFIYVVFILNGMCIFHVVFIQEYLNIKHIIVCCTFCKNHISHFKCSAKEDPVIHTCVVLPISVRQSGNLGIIIVSIIIAVFTHYTNRYIIIHPFLWCLLEHSNAVFTYYTNRYDIHPFLWCLLNTNDLYFMHMYVCSILCLNFPKLMLFPTVPPHNHPLNIFHSHPTPTKYKNFRLCEVKSLCLPFTCMHSCCSL